MAKPKAMPMARPTTSDHDYEAQDAANALMRAEEIRGDKDLHARAQKHVKRKFHAAARAMTAGKPKGKASRFTARAKLAGYTSL